MSTRNENAESIPTADEELAEIIERELLARRFVAPLKLPGFTVRLAAGRITADDWTALVEVPTDPQAPSAEAPR